MTAYTIWRSPFGELTITSSGGAITHLMLGSDAAVGAMRDDQCSVLVSARESLARYFAGQREEFDLPFAPAGTTFQQDVWRAMRCIPYGETATYGELAKKVGKPLGARAVGMACNRNPIMIMIPCHRVVGADGSLTGYACGLDMKEALLRLEGARLPGLAPQLDVR